MVVAKMESLQVRETSATPDRQSRSLSRYRVSEDCIYSSSMVPTAPCDRDYDLPLATVEDTCYKPAVASQRGEGLPYAPEGWPSPGDNWIWKVGKRRNRKGFWQDRYLILPRRLQKGARQVWFMSKKSVEDYIRKEYPDADLDSFFGSFQWKVPCAEDPLSEGRPTVCGKRGRDSEASGSASEEPLAVERVCKAGNLKCGLLTGKKSPLKAQKCDICCVEVGFCPECSCILCGKSTDPTMGEHSFIRCEGKLNEEFVCGHVAHLACSVLCHMGGVVRSIGLDVEYYCMRCDKTTDIMMHVVRLLQATKSIETRGVVENLNLASRALHGTRRIELKSLQTAIEAALKKLHSGMNLDDIGVLRDISVTVDAGRVGNTNGGVHYQPRPLNTSPLLLVSSKGETIQRPDHITCATDPNNTESESPFGSSFAARNQDLNAVQPAIAMPDIMSRKGNVRVHDRSQRRSRLLPEDTYGTSDLLDSPVHITDLKIVNKIHQTLQQLRESQEKEYKLAEEGLFAQKELLLNLFRQLDIAKSEFTSDSSSSSLESFDNLFVGVSDRVGRMRKEYAKFGQMLKISDGFGSTPKYILRDYFGLSVDDGTN